MRILTRTRVMAPSPGHSDNGGGQFSNSQVRGKINAGGETMKSQSGDGSIQLRKFDLHPEFLRFYASENVLSPSHVILSTKNCAGKRLALSATVCKNRTQ